MEKLTETELYRMVMKTLVFPLLPEELQSLMLVNVVDLLEEVQDRYAPIEPGLDK